MTILEAAEEYRAARAAYAKALDDVKAARDNEHAAQMRLRDAEQKLHDAAVQPVAKP